MTDRLNALIAMNPDFREALERGEDWALKHADSVRGIDGQSIRRHPERAHQEDGHTRRNWCGGCSDPEGCVTCDLDQPTGQLYQSLKAHIGKDGVR